jgi:hypothetical protein
MVATMDILSSLKFKRSELLKAAEDVCLALAEDPRSVSAEDRIIFQELGWNDRDVAREIGRCTSLKRWKREAGTNGQYADAVEQLDAVSKTVPKKVAELQVKVDELLAKIDDENSKLAKIQNQVDSFEYARRMLRENVPPFIRKQFDDEVSRIRTSESYIHMRELQSRRDMIGKILDELSVVNADNLAPIKLHAEGAGLDGIIPPPSPYWNQNRGINETVWMEYLDRLRMELPSVEAELSELEMTIDESLAAAETILDFYLEGK